jgi:hypothetical protein
MLFDVRKYTCRPGTIAKHLELYEKMGKAPQSKHLGQPVLYAKCETGDPNVYIHIWAYDNAGDREKKRAYTQESAKLGALYSQENALFNDVGFYPFKR